MGNYIFDTDFLFDCLIKDARDPKSSHDFGHDIIPKIIKDHHVNAFAFRDSRTGGRAYWRDVGTLDSFWAANMELLYTVPELNLYDKEWPLWTYQEQQPPAKFVFEEHDRKGVALESMVSAGCIISGAEIRRSILFNSVSVRSYSQINETVVLPDVTIGMHCKINKAIIDRGCQIPDGMTIGHDHDQDRANGFRVSSDGVVLVTRGMLGQEEGFF
jgi:glucose-1-phosphate adenylyltransferase